MNIYPVRKDTIFFKKFLDKLKLNKKYFLEIGTGNGELALKAAKKNAYVTATDIHEPSLKKAEKRASEQNLLNKINFKRSNLFEKIESKYDIIIFNPPYLPGEIEKKGRTWKGGKEGTKIPKNFLDQVKNYLTEEGSSYILLSTKSDIENLVDKYKLKKCREKKLWFEKIIIFESK